MAESGDAARTIRAYDMLSAQPATSVGLGAAERRKTIVSAVADADGKEHALSTFGDAKWDLSPYFENPCQAICRRKITWPPTLPAELVDDAKAVIYAWMKRGSPGSLPPAASTVAQVGMNSAIPFMAWLAGNGVARFGDAKPMHVTNYIHSVTQKYSARPNTAYNLLRILELIRMFNSEMISPLESDPFGAKTLRSHCGFKDTRGEPAVGKTPIIPAEVQSKIFNWCESALDGAEGILERLDRGAIGLASPKLSKLRNCALYIVLITSGMRISEVVGIEAGSWRSERKNGVDFHWVGTTEHKTKKGKVEYLIPALTLKALEIMARYAKPFQERLAEEMKAIEADAGYSSSPEKMAQAMRNRGNAKKLFLTASKSIADGGEKRVGALTAIACQNAMRQIAKSADVSWMLAPHQCRRTYARMFVESRMGRKSLMFLKWQFKHTSMSMTELYASNPMQDATMFDEILQEMTDFKIEIMESWMGDKPLSGGAGAEIAKMKLRGIPIKSRAALLADTADQVHIRATGHGWCLAQERGCGGAGLYEATRCVGCRNSVIDDSFADVWEGIYEQQIELLKIDDAGPAVQQRARRDYKWARQVMVDLELPIPAEDPEEIGGGLDEA